MGGSYMSFIHKCFSYLFHYKLLPFHCQVLCFVYNCFMNLYGILSRIAFYLILPFWLVVGIFKPKLVAGLKEKRGEFEPPILHDKSILFYGVSVGEIIGMTNLIKKTKEIFPQYKIVVTTGTATGQAIAKKNLSEVADFITYFPLDFPQFVEKSFRKLNPAAIIVMETEVWPNFTNYAKKNNIPLIIVNGRISDRTYKSYKRLSMFFAPILKNYTKILTQSKRDNEKLISIGANPETTTVMGNLKFDIKKSNLEVNLGKGRIIIAGSTHSGEDEIILNAFSELKNEFSDIKLLIAPRHPERNADVYALCEKTVMSCGKRSEHDTFNEKEIILLDTMGELSKMYSACHFAFIGGSFNKTGGHNPLECVIFNKPVVSGPSTHNFKDIYALITATDAGNIVYSPEELTAYMREMLSDDEYYKKACKDCEMVFDENRGALDFVVEELKFVIK